jgi:hypothetical protein
VAVQGGRQPGLVAAAAMLIAVMASACGASPSTRLTADVEIAGDERLAGPAVFDIPANLGVDCATYARRGLYEGQRMLQMMFAPAVPTQDAPLQQLAVAVSDYAGPGTYALDATSLRMAVRSRLLETLDTGTLVIGADASGTIRGTGRLAGGEAVTVSVAFRCAAAPG